MKSAEEMLRAVRDWVKMTVMRNSDCLKEEIRDNAEEFRKEVDLGTLLRKTGDASKVKVRKISTSFTGKPTFSEVADLDAFLGVVAAALGKISTTVYFGAEVGSYGRYDEIADDAAYEDVIEGGSYQMSKNTAMLIYGKGGAWTAAKGRATADFFRAYLVFWKNEPDSASYPCGWQLVQIGSAGQTARWSLASTLESASANYLLVFKIPKGSWAKTGVAYLNIPW